MCTSARSQKYSTQLDEAPIFAMAAVSPFTEGVRATLSGAPPTGDGVPGIRAVLLDMDGVLAEVSGSYRAAIVETAGSFGVTLTGDDIAEEKQKGGANNDWVLTQRMVTERWGQASGDAPPPTLEAITAKFEELYQGVPPQPGLKSLESLICAKGVLVELGRRLPGGLAIVTGRPRRDCMEFLELHGLTALFPASVCACMEDGAPKPDPGPVLRAAKAVGVPPAACLMIGDTPDDVRAAVAAGAVGLGVLTPHDAASALLSGTTESAMHQALMGCGAAGVMQPGLAQLLDLVPAQPLAAASE